MTSKQYYKQTSDMAFKLNDWRYDSDSGIFKANIQMSDTKYATTEDFLKNEDFFGLVGFDEDKFEDDICFIDEIDITFVLDSTHYKTYNVHICDVIDCAVVDGNMVLFCDDFELVEDVTLDEEVKDTKKEEEDDDEKCHCKDCEDNGCKCQHQVTLDWFRPDTVWGMDFGFPEFPNFTNIFNDMTKKIDDLKKDGGQFCEVSYRMDGDGNGHYRKVDNKGVTEKYFKRVDGEVKEVEAPQTKKLEITDESKPNTTGKTELKDLLK